MIDATAVQPDPNVMFELAVFAGGVGASALLTALARAYAVRRELLDYPGQRRSHAIPTPRGGGIGPVLVLLGGGGLLAATDPQSRVALIVCLLGLAMVAGVGWLDDHRPLSARLRLATHLAAAIAASIALIGAPDTSAQVALIVASVVVIAGLVNAWNFMDGINGIATSQAGLVAAVMLSSSWIGRGWLSGAWWNLALLLLAAACGFLPFNAPRARIFLGDVGSGALGFMVGIVLLRAVIAGGLPWPLAALVVSAFVVDAGMTLLSRVVRGKAWWRPHREHLYQWLVRTGYTHMQVACCYALWTLTAGALAIAAWRYGAAVGVLVSGGAIISGCLLWTWFRNRLWIAARHHPAPKRRAPVHH
jgi:UDP-N-acetylmuramyl pentapeptide phosphotransferase/UDP-N-acetylglucosamine-1-phosphate transferase